jgi:hypothetical protein
LREVDYTDADGRVWRVRVPDGCPEDMYASGVPVGPPSLGALGLPLEIEVRLHNQLHRRQLWTRKAVLARPNDVQGALQAALKVDMQRLQLLYLNEQGG